MADANVTLAALDDVPLFQGLSPDAVASINSCLRIESFPAGTNILVSGEKTPGLYVIRTGSAAAIVTNADGHEHELATLGRGECIGEISLISGEPCSATVRSITETEVWLLDTRDFIDLAEQNPELWRNLGLILSHRLVRTSRHVGASANRNLVALASDLTPQVETAVASAVAASLQHQANKRTLLVQTSEGTAYAGQSVPSLAAITADRTFLSMHERASGSLDPRVCTLMDEAYPSISGNDALAALDLLRPLYDCIIVTGWVNREDLRTLWRARAHSIVALVAGPSGAIPAWLETMMGLLDTPRKLDVAVLISHPSAPGAIQEIEDRCSKAVVRLVTSEDQLATLVGNPKAPDQDPGLSDAIDRLARLVGDMEIGLALGAGAAKGFAHIGVLKVLEEARIPIDYVVGCSIGAVVGSQYAYGISLDEIARSMRGVDKKVMRWTIPFRSVWSNRGLKELLSEPGGRIRFRDLKTPFAAVATDVAQGREIVLRRGIVWRAVMASISVPGMFPPVLRGRLQMVDGGLVNPVPSQVARDMGADFVIAVDLMGAAARASAREPTNGARSHVPNLVEMLWRANEIMQEEVTVRSASHADMTIVPKMGRVKWSDFSHKGREFIAAGEAAAREKLPELTDLLPRGISRPVTAVV